MKSFLQKLPYTLFVGLSLLALLQIAIIFKDSYSSNGKIEFTNQTPAPADLQEETDISNLTSVKTSINSASQAELEELPGIGVSLAKKIIESRPYTNIDELIAKAGLTSKVLDQIKDSITL